MTEREKIVVRVGDPNKLRCLQRQNAFEAYLYTKFILAKPVHKKQKWDIRSYVDYELAEDDASVVIMLKKGLSVDESNYALWSVAVLLKDAARKAKAAKKKLEKQAAMKAGGNTLLMYYAKKIMKYLNVLLGKLFNLPTELYHIIKRFYQRRGNKNE
jgi:hypothetical protein